MKGRMTAPYTQKCCPFCGVVSDGPHETQKGCIEALHGEIARMRELLDQVRSPWVPASAPEDRPMN